MTDCIGLVYAETETELSDLFDQVQSVIKTRQDKDMTDCTSVVYIENATKLSWSIGSSTVYDENQTGQWHNQS